MRAGVFRTDFAGPVEPAARFDDEVDRDDVAFDHAAGHDFQPLGIDPAADLAADQYPACPDFAFESPALADGDVAFGLDIALDPSVEVQAVAQGEIADQVGAGSDDGGSRTRTLLRTVSAKDSHSTRSSSLNTRS